MFIAQLLSGVLLLVIPALMLLSGRKYKQASAVFGSKAGFFCPSATLSAPAWDISQKIAAQFFMIGSVVLAATGLLLLFLIPADAMRTLVFIVSILIGLQLVMLVFLMALVEMRVQSKLKSSAA